MKQYLDLVRHVFEHGEETPDRTGTGMISIFGLQTKYDLREGFPLVTTKKVNFQNIIAELIWFLKGATNINDGLAEYTKIWNPWADDNGELGPVYGYQWIKWDRHEQDKKGQCKISHINQIQNAIDLIQNEPTSRRIIVSAWNVADLDRMALPPCHAFFQFHVAGDCLDLQLYQRSADMALGVPYNIASYSALLAMVAKECKLTPRFFVHTLGNAHIYSNHVEGLQKQLEREPHSLPTLRIADKSFWKLEVEDITVEDYEHHPFIKFPIAV